MDYRSLQTTDELEQVVQLEIAVWGLNPRDAVPVNIMRPIAMHGGMVIGAFDGGQMVGMCLAFPLRHHGRWVLWSHMTGIHPDYQGKGIGVGIKLAQRDWALANGYDEIGWTFDPLLRGNANFNLRLLGATASVYHVNYYGTMEDAINPPTPSDRVEARWKLRDRRAAALAQGKPVRPFTAEYAEDAFALRAGDSGEPVCHTPDLGARWLFAEIPRSRAAMSADTLNRWRLALRETLQPAFARGFVAVDFVETDGRSFYVLQAPAAWYLYVLQCSDDSLYTGIAVNVEARLKQHNAGRAAAYTASRRPVRLLGAWQFADRSSALKAEAAFKQLTRAAKLERLRRRLPYRDAPYIAPEIRH